MALFLSLAMTAHAAQVTCASIFAIRDFTSPRNHNPNQFQYFVHSIDIPLSKGLTVSEIHTYILNELATNPQRFLSTSLVDEKHPGTFGRIGFILEVPESSVVAAKPSDMGTSLFASGGRSAELINTLITYFKSKYPNTSPAEILNTTNPQSYNEVLISGKDLKIIGLFKKLVTTSEDQQLHEFAKQSDLPLIQLKDVPLN